jgi:vitamin B12 transporter
MKSLWLSASAILAWIAPNALAQTPAPDDEIVVTATGRAEERTRVAATVQVIDEDAIARMAGRSITELLAENAVGFFSEWTPAQTSVNIRGGASDGQGRDFRSQVLVLVNGRRAGTANLSKLSAADIARVEIVRGPASVIYGSQALGGVVNLITKDGQSGKGGLVALTGGSWGLAQGQISSGGAIGAFDYYVSASGGRRDDYESGNGGSQQVGTDWTRRGGALALGYAFSPEHRLALTARTDGTYNAGFRGSSWNTINREDRTNASMDFTYTGDLSEVASAFAQAYAVRDEDIFRWASPVIRSGVNPAPGTSSDLNKRRLDVIGLRLQPEFRLFQGNRLLVGLDLEESRLRSTRFRVALPGGPAGQVPPFDNNQTETVTSIYAESAQSFINDALTLRAGARAVSGETRFEFTPNLALASERSVDYDASTWFLGGTWRIAPTLTLRASASTGFRAPTATELGADFTALGGGRTFGNPNLRPEESRQVEIGALWIGETFRLDAALFENRIEDRIITRPRVGVANTSDWANNPAPIVIRGLDAQGERRFADIGANADLVFFGSGQFHFDMEDRGAPATANAREVERVYQYQASVGSRLEFAQERPWSLQALGVLRGPMWYNTEENLLIPQGEPFRDFIHEKDPFWIVNLRAEWRTAPSVTLFAAANNVFDVNEHPIFIALDESPFIGDARFSNGGRGNSMPGREFQVGLRSRF